MNLGPRFRAWELCSIYNSAIMIVASLRRITAQQHGEGVAQARTPGNGYYGNGKDKDLLQPKCCL